MLAAGYVLGADTFQKAREIDEHNQLTAKVSAAATAAKEKVLEIDQQLKISETIGAIGTGVANKAREVDEAWKISENISSGYTMVSTNIQAGVENSKGISSSSNNNKCFQSIDDKYWELYFPFN